MYNYNDDNFDDIEFDNIEDIDFDSIEDMDFDSFEFEENDIHTSNSGEQYVNKEEYYESANSSFYSDIEVIDTTHMNENFDNSENGNVKVSPYEKSQYKTNLQDILDENKINDENKLNDVNKLNGIYNEVNNKTNNKDIINITEKDFSNNKSNYKVQVEELQENFIEGKQENIIRREIKQDIQEQKGNEIKQDIRQEMISQTDDETTSDLIHDLQIFEVNEIEEQKIQEIELSQEKNNITSNHYELEEQKFDIKEQTQPENEFVDKKVEKSLKKEKNKVQNKRPRFKVLAMSACICILVGCATIFAIKNVPLDKQDNKLKSPLKTSTRKDGSQDSDEAVAYNKGEIKDNVYVNSWTNMKLDFPKEYHSVEEEFYMIYNSSGTECGLYLTDDKGNYIINLFSDMVDEDNDVKGFLKNKSIQVLETNCIYKHEMEKEETINIAGKEHYVMHYKGDANGVKIEQSYYACQIGNKVSTIIISIINSTPEKNNKFAELFVKSK